jgi:hypothetical protein
MDSYNIEWKHSAARELRKLREKPYYASCKQSNN